VGRAGAAAAGAAALGFELPAVVRGAEGQWANLTGRFVYDGTFAIQGLPVGEPEFQVWHERIGYLETPQWSRGRFEMIIPPEGRDLGAIKLAPALFEKDE